ncbi:snaclec rhodocytin subunit alpha-like [Fundulus heteroclitus]|uniref:snaclec rhodocytin subunit alpha-like n=1 Tax=Fundulus heteroclitus TaxID=8078 RepID=UPI00165B0F18|nr:snaclec rhodocytin subunit alpha-like [Fundulus heteroclitus]
MWKWSRGDEEATYFNWEDEVPQENEDCVFKPTNTTKWRGRACNKSRVFMCYDELLVLMKKNKTWEEALEHCRTLKEMGSYDLATLITHDDHDYARERAQQATTDEVWTGLRYLGDEWLWMGGEVVQYENIPSCSGAWCGVLEKNGDKSFGIRDCGQRRNFFCYKKY